MDPLRTLALTGLLVAVCLPVGSAALRLLGLEAKDVDGAAEHGLLAVAAGLGTLALLLTLVGLAGALWAPVVLALPAALALLSWPLAMTQWGPWWGSRWGSRW